MTTQTPASASTPTAPRVVDVELLAIDLDTCTRCTGTLANIEAAIDAVRQVAQPTGTTIRLRKVVIDSEAAARAHRFVTSPTIRVGGRNIVFETIESRCDACSDLCGCDEGTSCRVWRYQGQEYTEAPVGLVVEALLREIAGLSPAPGEPQAADIHVPENLRRFFAGGAAREEEVASDCCPPTELESCCAPAEKDVCCPPATASCGCA